MVDNDWLRKYVFDDDRAPNCPEEYLVQCIQWVCYPSLFRLLSAEPQTVDRIRLELKADAVARRKKLSGLDGIARVMYRDAAREYSQRQEISERLFAFLDTTQESGELDDETLRKSLVRGLANHVELCIPCMEQYTDLLERLAEKRASSRRFNSLTERLIGISAIMLAMDEKLLGLLKEKLDY